MAVLFARLLARLSPIELAWSKVKTLLRGDARAREALEAAVVCALRSISSSDARGWFRHDGYIHGLITEPR